MNQVPTSFATPQDEYFNMVYDPLSAALAGFSPVPVLVIAALLGLVPRGVQGGSRDVFGLKTAIAVVTGTLLQALRPLAFGLKPSWPDIFTPEVFITLGLEALLAYAVVRLTALARTRLHLDPNRIIHPLQ